MKIKHLLTKTLLVAAGLLLGGANSVWGTPTVIKTYDFYSASVAVSVETSVSTSGTTTIGSTVCDNLTGDWAGICLQGSGGWKFNRGGSHAYDGLYNNNGGGRIFGLLNLKAGDIVTINANGGLATSATNATYDSGNSTATCGIYTITADGNFGVSLTRYYQITSVTITRDVADLEAPTYTITGANGVERQVTLSCLTDGAAIKYNTVNDKSAAGWTSYSAPFYTSEATLYAYSEKNSNTSDVVTITTGAGTTIKLNAPTLTKTAYSAGEYTVSITSDQSNLSVVPTTHIIKYSIDGGAATTLVSSPIQIAEGSTVSAYVELSGYTTSSTTECVTAARPTYYATEWTQDYRNVTSAAGTGVQAIELSDVVFTVDGVDFKNIVSYGSPATAVSLNTNVGLNTKDGVGLRANGANSGIIVNNTNDAKIGIQNLKVGDYIVLYVTGIVPTANYGCTLQEGMSTWSEYYFLATETSASINIPKGTYNYVYTITVLSSSVPATISAANWATLYTPYALDFSTLSSEVEAYTATLSGTTVTLNKVSNVPANTGIVLKKIGGTGSYDIPVIASSSTAKGDLTGNASDDTAFDAFAGNDLYMLAQAGGDVQFKKVTSGSIAAGKAFLKVAQGGGAPALDVVFDNETTGIADVRSKMEDVRSDIFDLQGRKVAQPQKGLYIVNGKKVVIK